MQRRQVALVAAMLVLPGCATTPADDAEPVASAQPADGSAPSGRSGSATEPDRTDGGEAARDASSELTDMPEEEQASRVADDASSSTESQTDDSCVDGHVDVNAAPEHELQRIVHIGSARAEQLRELRPFSNLRDLTRIPGIGEKRLSDIVEQGLACAT